METGALAREGKKRLSPRSGAGRSARCALDITVLMGGPSSERDISLVSGKAVADALERRGHRVTRADISPRDAGALDRKGIDLVFPVLHGWFGEDGQVQALCESRGLTYVGSGPEASRLGMNKDAAKIVFRQAGLCTPDWIVVERADAAGRGGRGPACLGLPVVLKPVDGGSSVDVTIARDEAGRDAALEALLAAHGRALVERFVKGRELTVGILGEQALPVIQIVPAREFYDKVAKYADGAGTQYVFDHGLSDDLVRWLQRCAVEAHAALGCRDMSRVDFILDDAGSPCVLEVNTIPGFTSHSLLPMAAARVGIGFDELVDRLAAMAMRRRAGN